MTVRGTGGSNNMRRVILMALVAALALGGAAWSIYRTVTRNSPVIVETTPRTLLDSIKATEAQMEKIRKDPGMDKATKQRVLGMIAGEKAKAKAEYEKMTGEKLPAEKK